MIVIHTDSLDIYDCHSLFGESSSKPIYLCLLEVVFSVAVNRDHYRVHLFVEGQVYVEVALVVRFREASTDVDLHV